MQLKLQKDAKQKLKHETRGSYQGDFIDAEMSFTGFFEVYLGTVLSFVSIRSIADENKQTNKEVFYFELKKLWSRAKRTEMIIVSTALYKLASELPMNILA